MSEESLKKRKRQNKFSQLARFWRREGRKYCAIALCASLIAGNIGHMAVAASDGQENDYEFELDRVTLYEALQEAIENGNTVDKSFNFSGSEADTYASLLEADGDLYELTPNIEANDSEMNLRIFARLNQEIALESTYEIDGSEEMIFLLTNESGTEKAAVIAVDDKVTEQIKVAPRKAVSDTGTANAYTSAADFENGPGSGGGGNSSAKETEAVIETENESGSEEVPTEAETEIQESEESADIIIEPEDSIFEENDPSDVVIDSDVVIEEESQMNAKESDIEAEIPEQIVEPDQDVDTSIDEAADIEISVDTDDEADIEDGGQEVDAEITDDSEQSDETEDFDSSELSASISYHKIYRVASKASASNATASPSNATPSNATDSNADKSILEGIIYEAVGIGGNSAVAFVTTMDDLELEVAVNELSDTSNLVCVYEAELEDVTIEVRTLKGTFHENVTLEVTKLEADDDAYKNAEEVLTKNGTEYDGMMALDICFLDSEGNEIEPENERDVWVSIQLKNSLLPQDVNHETLSVQHLKENEDGSIELEHVADTAGATDGTVVTDVTGDSSSTTIAEFSIKSFSTFAISWQAEAAAVDYTSYSVTFDIGEDAKAAGVEIPDLVYTSEDTGCVDSLPTPIWNDENGKSFLSFGGWYYDGKEFDTETIVSEDITVVANWVSVTDNSYHVNFYNQAGDTVLLTVAVEKGQKVSPATASLEENKIFRGWSTTLKKNSPLENLVAFDFSKAVSDAVTGSKTLNLYAWYGDAVNVSFVSNGGIAVPTKTIASGETVENPTTTREGYTFVGWSSSKEEYVAFDFSTELTADITLYAFWNANQVPVTLVYMYENADDDGYTPAGISQTVYAPAGSYVSVVKSTITAIGQKHALMYSETSDGKLTGTVKQTANGSAATIPDVSGTYFQYNSASNKRLVMPDGSTVMLIYYNRARITLTFTYTTSNNNNNSYPNGSQASLSGYTETDKYQVSYETGTGNLKFTYSFTAKYRQNISPVWPQIGWVSNDSSGNKTFYTWLCPDDHNQSSNMYTLESSLFNGSAGLSIVDGVLIGTGALSARATNVSVDWLIYARTTLPGETADFTYNGQSYTIYTEACQKAYSSNGYGYKALDGCTSVSGEPKWSTTYSNLSTTTSMSTGRGNNQKTVSTAGSSKTIKTIFNSVFGASNISDNDRCQILLYDRSEITLSLHPNDDTYGTNTETDSYLYGDWIYNESTDLLKTVESKMKKNGYTFAGWYTDPNFIDGTQYEPSADSRIYANMELYAKWDPSQFKAEFYLYMDDSSPYREEGFAEGGKLTDWLVPPEVQDSFVGWYWYQDGKLQPFDFTSAVGANHVDEDGVIKLYAVWEGTNGKVCYLPGEGGDNDTQTEYDERDFAINEASVELPDPSDVWTDGSVPDESGLIFVGWKAPNGAIYQPGRYVLVTRTLMQFEAQWTTDAVTLVYDANGGSGSNVTETWARGSVVEIWDNMNVNTPHFTREGYELIGWDKDETATEPTYKLGEGEITLSIDKTTLYAIWKRLTIDVTIKKVVAGILGDRSKSFDFSVTAADVMDSSDSDEYKLSSDNREAKFSLAHNGMVTLKGVKIGTTLTIAEKNADGYQMSIIVGNSDTAIEGNSYMIPENAESISITVKNIKEGDVDTGVLLDSMPYVLILAAVIAGVAFYFIRKKKDDEDDLD